MMRISWTTVKTNQRVYELAETRSVGLLLKHVRERKLRYFGHITRQRWDNIEGSLMILLREARSKKAKNILYRHYYDVDWPNEN